MWTENVILADADYLDRVAFELIVNFERMLGRRVPPVDLCHMADCLALDGGLRPGDNETTFVMLHDKGKKALANFKPADYETELTAQAFRDNLGEFVFQAFPVEDIVSKEAFFIQSLEQALTAKEVKRLMVIPDESYRGAVAKTMAAVGDKPQTLFSMLEPLPGLRHPQELLGYAMMSALGIRSEELG